MADQSLVDSISPSTRAAIDSVTDFSHVRSEIIRASAPGAPDYSGARTLLRAVGTNAWSLEAVPTSRGAVCFSLGGFEAGCVASFVQNPLNFTASDHGGVWHVYGIVANDVRSISIVVGHKKVVLPISNNAFYYEVPAGVDPATVRSIVARTDTGKRKRLSLSLSSPTPIQQ